MYGGDMLRHSITPGLEHLRERSLNKGLAFSYKERFTLGLHGLMPCRVKTLREQVDWCKARLSIIKDDLDKYLYLTELHATNETLFFKVLTENLVELLPIVYTPTVAQAVLKFGIIYRQLRALYVNIYDKGNLEHVVRNWPQNEVQATVLTDGERCLGLGDMGVNSVCISVGKMGLYTALAGVKPHVCMPIVIDAGTNNPKLLEDPFYVGLKEKRVTGPKYDEFVDELLQAVVNRFTPRVLFQFEDFGNHNAFRYLEKYRNQYCCFNDDIQGTAGVTVAGFLTSKRILGKQLKDHKYLYLGAGEAAVGIADLSCKLMVELEGLSLQEARSKIWMFDINGLLTKSRPEGLEERQSVYAVDHAVNKDFLSVVNEFKPSVLIGVCTVGRTFTPAILKAMGSFNERPMIFALSNPNSKAECTPLEAYENTEGRAIYASGSPFGDVEYNGKIYKPGQGNNAYIYPGMALGGIIGAVRHISDDVEFLAAKCVCDCTTDEDLKVGSLYPPLSKIQDVSANLAVKMLEYGLEKGICTIYPKPKDMMAYVKSRLYKFDYEDQLPRQWNYPEQKEVKLKSTDITLALKFISEGKK
ncbi:hypothetical protein Trydic_g19341 [Trypoxylus dichotomus]